MATDQREASAAHVSFPSQAAAAPVFGSKDASKRPSLFGRARAKENEELTRLRDWVARTQGLGALQVTELLGQAHDHAKNLREQAEAEVKEIKRQAEADARQIRADAKEAAKQQEEAARQAGRSAERSRREVESSRQEIATLEGQLTELRAQTVVTEELLMLQQVGVYAYHHPLQDAIAYRTQLDSLQAEIKRLAAAGMAVRSVTDWTVNGSRAEGKKMVRDFSKLMLRAYNAEADQAVRTMRPHRLQPLVDRLYKTRETIAKLGATMQIRIADEYHDARVRELYLTADYLQKKDEEKEAQRELRARQREEEKAQREFDRERGKLEKELEHTQRALQRLHERGDADGAMELEAKLQEIQQALTAVAERAANIRTGYVYVISNVGAFGDRIVKIGLTRRLEPLDRIYELSGASVPFRFDVHALIFSEDAVGLETKLHQRFADRRVNRVNSRREFFYVSPAEVRDALGEFAGQHLVEFVDEPEALEWRASTMKTAPVGS
ncbi:DUF4041 domain-containing protein [Kitasatospora sp. NPDC085895]|uniref:DUF4041 domain-containing protein n=1 Tax=Kitasatospora sp. NPDC085895 TaxID=3155057 RepID=UPI0034504FE2